MRITRVYALCATSRVRLFFFLIFQFVLLVPWVASVRAASPEMQASSKEVPVVETFGFEFLVTDRGALQYAVKAERMRRYQNGNVALEGGVELRILEAGSGPEPQVCASIQAHSLLYDVGQKACTLAGTVRVEQLKEGFSMATEKLTYRMEKEIFCTDCAVSVQQGTHNLQGVGLVARKDLASYSIGKPHGTTDVAEMPASPIPKKLR